MLCLAASACVGKYDSEPQLQPQATAESIAKEGRYSIMQALSRDGTNRPVPGTFYYLNSPLGSTSVMFDTQGAALLRLEYFPDGTVNNAASQGDYIATHTFGQKEYDKELEAYYNAFRYYDAETMRFTTPDAIKESSDFLVHNIYAYTRNNPVNYTDPTGFSTMQIDGGGCRNDATCRAVFDADRQPYRTAWRLVQAACEDVQAVPAVVAVAPPRPHTPVQSRPGRRASCAEESVDEPSDCSSSSRCSPSTEQLSARCNGAGRYSRCGCQPGASGP